MDITKFNQVSACNIPAEMPIIDSDDVTETGIVLKILGTYADKVQKALSVLDRQAQARLGAELQKQRGQKDILSASLRISLSPEEARKVEAQRAACRVVGWDGPDVEFSESAMMELLMNNPGWVRQVLEFSDNMGNFTSKT